MKLDRHFRTNEELIDFIHYRATELTKADNLLSRLPAWSKQFTLQPWPDDSEARWRIALEFFDSLALVLALDQQYPSRFEGAKEGVQEMLTAYKEYREIDEKHLQKVKDSMDKVVAMNIV